MFAAVLAALLIGENFHTVFIDEDIPRLAMNDVILVRRFIVFVFVDAMYECHDKLIQIVHGATMPDQDGILRRSMLLVERTRPTYSIINSSPSQEIIFINISQIKSPL